MGRIVVLGGGGGGLGGCEGVEVLADGLDGWKGPPPDLVLVDAAGVPTREVADLEAAARARWPRAPVRRLEAPAVSDADPTLDRGFFEFVVNHLPSGIVVLDPEGVILFANAYTQTWAGMSGEELRGLTLRRFCPGVAEFERRGQLSGETSCRYCGKHCPIGFRLLDLVEGDVRTGKILSFTDLHHVIVLRRSLRLKERLAAMGQVISQVAQEIRNPLFAMTGAAQILERELDLSGRQAELFDTLVTEAHRLNGTIQGVIDFTRELELHPVWFDLRRAVETVIEALRPAPEGPEVLLEPGSPAQILADSERIEAVVEQLLLCAATFSPSAQAVEVSIDPVDDQVVLRVSVPGASVVDSALDELFLPVPSADGAGPNLAHERKVAEAHQGLLSASSRFGEGTVFTLELPQSGRVG